MEWITDMAARRADLRPDKAAFIDAESGQTLSFAAVDDRANRLARALRARKLTPGDRVAVLCLNRPDFFVLLFACLKAELILVPLNWRQPAPELAPILARSGARLLLHDEVFAQTATTLATEAKLTRFRLDGPAGETDTLAALIADQPSGAFGPGRRRAGDPWYLLFTSGTTGLPKAVIQTFGMGWANALNIGQPIDLRSDDVSVNYLPLFHTAGINLHTLPIFLFGGTSHVLRRFDQAAAMRLIGDGALTLFFGVPAIYQALALDPGFEALNLSSVRHWGSGGAPLPEPVIRRWAERGAVLCQGMGMTETGPTVFLMDRAAVLAKPASVGKPQVLAEVRLVGRDGAVIAGPGDGELEIRGPGVTPGYWQDGAATRAAFTEDGWLRSGDVARRDQDGYYAIVDRIKDMFISGGENVYPAEVERALAGHPDILEAAVLGVPDDRWGEVGHAYLIARPGRSVDLAALPGWCRERLAAYKVPKRFVLVDDLPRTAAGKVQKHVLKAAG